MNGISASFVKSQIDRVRREIGREISVFTPDLSACPLCLASGLYDPINDVSYYFTCPICAGAYWLNTETETRVLARVHWVGNEAIQASPGGKYFTGDGYVHVDPCYHALFQQAQSDSGKLVVDGQDMEIIQIRPMGAPMIDRYKIIIKSMGSRPTLPTHDR